MAMTKLEVAAKRKIEKILNEQGYPTYSSLLGYFDINLTEDPSVIGYMEPERARIVLNKGLDIDQVSMVVRHEILHEYLAHFIRAEKHVGKDKWDKRTPQEHQNFNIAADYEISNRGYTDADKTTARGIKLNGEILQGLVTEDQHPDWVNMTMEEMYDALTKEMERNKKNTKNQMDNQQVRIGDKGDKNIQDAEELERQANAVMDDAGEEISEAEQEKRKAKAKGDKKAEAEADDKKEDAERAKETAKKIKDEAEKLGKEAKSENNKDGIPDENKDSEDAGDLFNEKNSDMEKQEKISKRIHDLRKILDNENIGKAVQGEASSALDKESEIKAAQDAKKFSNSPIQRFTASINNFIKKETATGRGNDWGKINKKYANTGILRPGVSRRRENKIPLVNVYFDRSGSWDAGKTEVGSQAISTLNNYVRQGKIKINLYYFNTRVLDKDPGGSGGTSGQPILDHIKQTNPDNVIVMTDSDISDCHTSVVVPGAVWFLFVDGRSENLMNHLSGQKLTQAFDIDYNDI